MTEDSGLRVPIDDPDFIRMIAEFNLEPVEGSGSIPEGQTIPYQPTPDELPQLVQQASQARAAFAAALAELAAEQGRRTRLEEVEGER